MGPDPRTGVPTGRKNVDTETQGCAHTHTHTEREKIM